MARVCLVLVVALCLSLSATAKLSRNFYAKTCPDLEDTVRLVVKTKIQQTFVTIPSVLRLFFHDCYPNGCDASIMITSTPKNKAERDHPDNLSLAGDGFDTVVLVKRVVDANPKCRDKVSCADILALATREVVVAAGGPFYEVELGRFDSLTSTAASINGKIPQPSFKLSTLLPEFASKNLTMDDLVALSAAHTVGFAHCRKIFNRIYTFSRKTPVDPTLNKTYAENLRRACPKNVDPRIALTMDPTTPFKFDNVYFKNLQQGKGLFTSDQDLYQDRRSRPKVNAWAADSKAFNKAFVTAMTKLGRVGVLTKKNGNIRTKCDAFNH